MELLPKHLLYVTGARIGGIGLDLCAQEQLKLSQRGGFLGKAVAFQNRCPEISDAKVRSLRWSPVRLISFLDRPYYYGAKRRYADRAAAGEMRTGRYDFLHGWSGDSLRVLREANRRGVPSVLDIPTWHVAHGFRRYEKRAAAGRLVGAVWLPRRWLDRLPIRPGTVARGVRRGPRCLLTRSTYATETFSRGGVSRRRRFSTRTRGQTSSVFVRASRRRSSARCSSARFDPAQGRASAARSVAPAQPARTRSWCWSGTCTTRSGPSWNGSAAGNVRVVGKAERVEDFYRAATVHIFPVAVRRLREGDVRGGGVRAAADHHA